MNRRIWLWTGLIFLVGIGLAIPFRRQADPTTKASTKADDSELTLRISNEPSAPVAQVPGPSRRGGLEPIRRPQGNDYSTRQSDGFVPAKVENQSTLRSSPAPTPPRVSPLPTTRDESSTQDAPALLPKAELQRPIASPTAGDTVRKPPFAAVTGTVPSSDSMRPSAAGTLPSRAPTPDRGSSPPVLPARSRPMTHRIEDGDSLQSLAAHYLGDSQRYLEIFDANRQVLDQPDLLPIGVTLHIPAGDAPDPIQRLPSAADPKPADSDLVPVPRELWRRK